MVKRLFFALALLPFANVAHADSHGQHNIPRSCDSQALRDDVNRYFDARIHAEHIEILADSRGWFDTEAYDPGVNGVIQLPGNYGLECHLKVTYGPGDVQYGEFTEHHEANGQVVMSFD